MSPTTAYTPARPSAADLVRQGGSVLADLPRFVLAPLVRPWHLRWGATPAEATAPMPGDDRLPHAPYRCTRAITIDAPPAAVWPWLVQVGCLRGGFYSNDLLDNLAHSSATTIIPQLQHLRTGQWVPMSPTPSPATAFTVDSFDVGRWLLWTKSDSTWAWTLTPAGNGTTRLITRVHACYDWTKPASAPHAARHPTAGTSSVYTGPCQWFESWLAPEGAERVAALLRNGCRRRRPRLGRDPEVRRIRRDRTAVEVSLQQRRQALAPRV
jgi:hypothetical protein